MKPEKIIEYTSEDGYFKIQEKVINKTVEVKCIFSTKIMGIENFYTIRTYNVDGRLIKYSNSLKGSTINYEEPVNVLTAPKLIQDGCFNDKGTFIGLRVEDESKKILKKLARKYKVPNLIRSKKLHTTVIYSFKELPNYIHQKETKHTAKLKQFVIFENPNGSKVLAIEIESESITKENKILIEEQGAIVDYETYRPHITLSYKIGDFELPILEETGTIIEFDEEYTFEIKL